MRPHSSTSKEKVSLMAVAALDDLVNELVKASAFRMAPQFLDWVADEATPLVEHCVARSYRSSRFVSSLQAGDPKIAMTHWVRHWVSPWIVSNFDQLAPFLPEFADSKPALPDSGFFYITPESAGPTPRRNLPAFATQPTLTE